MQRNHPRREGNLVKSPVKLKRANDCLCSLKDCHRSLGNSACHIGSLERSRLFLSGTQRRRRSRLENRWDSFAPLTSRSNSWHFPDFLKPQSAPVTATGLSRAWNLCSNIFYATRKAHRSEFLHLTDCHFVVRIAAKHFLTAFCAE